ncbi:MAG: phage terminase large subunit PBSX family [Fusobacteria bacterium]|nr:MAG: phage terminase large subunit PBSX family [Fusobacteriota bacterium]KAF0228967.1 MAG: phage terminase large subunit PBSX [Fusobacteriota bacterium]
MKKLRKEPFNKWVWKILDNYKHRIEVYYGGAGSGKSYGAMQKVILKACNSKRRVLVIRKVQRTIKESIFRLTLELLGQAGLTQFAKINRTDFTIVLSNGSEFIFKGLDDPEKIKSIHGITDIVIEEATDITLDDFTQLNLRLRPGIDVKDPQIFLMFNPVSKVNWVYPYFFVNKPKDCLVIKTNYKDNKFLTKDYIKTLEDMAYRNPAYYKIYALGTFATLDKLVYRYTKRIIPFEEVKDLPLFCGLDFGYINDPSAFISVRIDEIKKKIYIVDEYFKKGMLNDEIARTINDLGYSKEVITADSAEQKSIAEIKKYGISRIKEARKGPDSVINGIQYIQQYELIVDERCPKIIEELDNYTWMKDKKSGEYVNKPVDMFNHGLDALRYAIESLIKGANKMTVRKKPIGL